MVSNRIEAGILAQSVDLGPDLRQPTQCRRSRSRLCQPAANRIEVITGLVGVAQPAWHGAARSAAGPGRPQFVIPADTVTPCVDLGRVVYPSGGNRCIRLGDPGGFPSDPALPVG